MAMFNRYVKLPEGNREYAVVGGFNPSEKYESQLGYLSPTYGKINHVPNTKQ